MRPGEGPQRQEERLRPWAGLRRRRHRWAPGKAHLNDVTAEALGITLEGLEAGNLDDDLEAGLEVSRAAYYDQRKHAPSRRRSTTPS